MTRFYWAAASIVTIFSVSSALFYLLVFSNASSTELYAEYYSPYPNVISVTQRGEEVELDELQKGFYAYENNLFEKAIEHFEKAIANNDTSILKFYIGSSYMGLDKMEKAIPFFEKIANDSSGLSDQANWYLALCYLKKDNIEKTKDHLSKLQTGKGTYKEKADKLMNDLE